MKAMNQALPLSEETQAGRNDLSKREQKTKRSDIEILFARCRSLEHRLNEMTALLSAVRRDVNRIDRKQLRDAKSPDTFNPDNVPAEPMRYYAGLFT